MKKQIFGRKFKRDVNERKALFKSLISSLILHGRIITTEEKAKAIKGEVDKVITKAKKGAVSNLLRLVVSSDALQKLTQDIAPRFKKRAGGYTRIIKTGRRLSDNAAMAIIELVEFDKKQEEKKLQVKKSTPLKVARQTKRAVKLKEKK